jgi:Fe-S-cluster-containing hydrogenase component 2
MTGHTFITHLCECIGDCVPTCPVECIHRGVTMDGLHFSYIDNNRCIDCGACASVCPIEGAIIEWSEGEWPAIDGPLPGLIVSAKQKEKLQQRVRSIARVDLRSQARAQLWAVDCAARVVDIYEFFQSADESVRHAVVAARAHALAFSHFASEAHDAFLEQREVDPVAREKLKAARAYSESWKEAASKAGQSALRELGYYEPARLAAEAASAACTGNWYAAMAAADAVYALFLPQSEMKARAARENEIYWQHHRLINRMSLVDDKDWPLRSPGRSNPFERAASGANLTLGSRASALNPAEIRHYRRTQAYDFHH